MANSIDPNQMLYSEVSDLGLYFLLRLVCPNQIVYSSALISSPSFKALAQIVIKISCSQEKGDK